MSRPPALEVRAHGPAEVTAGSAGDDPRVAHRSRRWDVAAVAGGGALFVLALGVRNGEFNLVFYLLRGIHDARPTALRNDWYTEDTEPFHVVWNHLVAASVRVDALDVVLTAGAVLCGLAVAAGLYVVARALYQRPLLPWLATLTLLAGTYTRSLGDFYLLPPTFEPFGIGGAALVAGLAALAWRRPLLAGLAFGVCGFWHLQLGTLAAALLAGATIAAWRDLSLRDATSLWLPYLVLSAPNAVLAASLTRATGADEATRILRTVAPQQYEPWTTDRALLVAFGAALVFGATGLLLRRASMTRLFRGAVAGAVAVVVVALAVGAASGADLVVRAMPWRLAALVVAVMFLFGSAGLLEPDRGRPARGTRRPALVTVAYGALVVAALVGPGRMKLAVLGVVVASGALSAVRRGLPAGTARRVAYGGVGVALAVVSAHGLRQSHVGFQSPAEDRAAVYRFAAGTPAGTVFAVPLDLVDFRLLTERAIVVDWGAPPLYNPDVLEWRDRLVAVSGRDELGSLDGLLTGYETATCTQLRLVAERYEVDLFVTRGPPAPACTEPVLEAGAFRVSRVRP